jgi:hypothetical protein
LAPLTRGTVDGEPGAPNPPQQDRVQDEASERPKKPQHRIRLADDLYRIIAAEAERQERSVRWVIERVLRERFLPQPKPAKEAQP